MMRVGAGLWMLLIALLAPPARAEPPQATVAQGRIAGVWEQGLRVFRNIPYAAPPVGERRWRPPLPPLSWPGIRDAAAFGPACVQPPYPAGSVYFEPPRSMNEDCLTLNIWAPKAAKGAPVILWIHGGALLRGASASPIYDGAGFAKRGVVFVSINYRLGALGWLAHPALSAESAEGVSGNYGLRDQIAALTWVRRNIEAFGGDAANVTVMGESAGALSTAYLLASPRARGLFAKAIVQSPNLRAMPRLRASAFGLPSAEAVGVGLAEALGAKDLADLRALDAETIAKTALDIRFRSQPVVDGALVPAQLVDILDRNEQAKVALLAGFNSGEVRSQRALIPPAPVDAVAYESEIARRYGDLAPAYLKLYPAADIDESLIAATRDAVYGWATERLVRAQTAAGVPAYLYIFDHCYAAARARDLCAFHASELPFVFGRVGDDAGLPPNWPPPNGATDRTLAETMIDYWTNFARTGAPVAAGSPDWPAYGRGQYYLHISPDPAVGRDPFPGMFELNAEVVRRRRDSGRQWFVNIGPAAPVSTDRTSMPSRDAQPEGLTPR